jgi:hypothetical protein
MAGEVFSGWEEVRLTLGNGRDGLRVIAGIYDPQGKPGAISDLVAVEAGLKQQSAGGRLESDGRIQGTYWHTEGDQHTPHPLTEVERDGLRALAMALRARCSSVTRTS